MLSQPCHPFPPGGEWAPGMLGRCRQPQEKPLGGDVTTIAIILPGHPHITDVQAEALKSSAFLRPYS